ncbi:hypothetical protein N9N45_01750, partial [Planktomarina temperata]|nr:hypothetical protein [Planktomarina temperata]
VQRHAAEFLGKIGVKPEQGVQDRAPQLADQSEEITDDETATGAAGALAETSARDFVIVD